MTKTCSGIEDLDLLETGIKHKGPGLGLTRNYTPDGQDMAELQHEKEEFRIFIKSVTHQQ